MNTFVLLQPTFCVKQTMFHSLVGLTLRLGISDHEMNNNFGKNKENLKFDLLNNHSDKS